MTHGMLTSTSVVCTLSCAALHIHNCIRVVIASAATARCHHITSITTCADCAWSTADYAWITAKQTTLAIEDDPHAQPLSAIKQLERCSA